MASPTPLSTGLPSPETRSDAWTLEPLAGRLVEISGHHAAASLTAAFGLVLDAQQKSEPAAWVTLRQSTFFPPDVADSGIDLSQLAVVRVPDLHAAYRATVELTRSGGFGLVVLDLGPPMFQKMARPARKKNLSVPFITKLVGLAQKTSTAVVVLTEKTRETSSLSSLVSLRVEASRSSKPNAPCEVELEVLKDKRRGPGRRYREVCRAPAGLR
jgi:recombination protein RecA